MSEHVLIWLLIEQDGASLLARRKPEARPFGGMWTLPGDLMGQDESAVETVDRFSRSQLGAAITAGDFVDTFFVKEEGTDYAVTVFRPASIDGPLRYRESGPYDEVRWAVPEDLPSPIIAAVSDVLHGKRHWQGDEADGRTDQSA